MADKPRRNWTKEETILAFELYCRTPFGKISSGNPDIMELANFIGRTPGAVALKMHNLAHYDPVLIERDVSAMSHGSKLDPEVFYEFYKNLEELTYTANRIRTQMSGVDFESDLIAEELSIAPEGIDKEQWVKTRLGQYYFRVAILNRYEHKCCVTGIAEPQLLIASHIKPWAKCDELTERTNPMNGLCLNALHDKAFDKGLITIDTNYRIIVSSKLNHSDMDKQTRDWFFSYNREKIFVPEGFAPAREFIEYHNDVIFIG